MARWLTDIETASMNAGMLPVLYAVPDPREPLDHCIGWAATEGEAYELIKQHPNVLRTLTLIPGQPEYHLAGVAPHAIGVGDLDGKNFPFLRKPYPGTYFAIQAFVPRYELDPQDHEKYYAPGRRPTAGR